MNKYTVTNKEEATESNVVLLNNGKYSVTLKDLDSGERLPYAYIFTSLDDAIKKANFIANIR